MLSGSGREKLKHDDIVGSGGREESKNVISYGLKLKWKAEGEVEKRKRVGVIN